MKRVQNHSQIEISSKNVQCSWNWQDHVMMCVDKGFNFQVASSSFNAIHYTQHCACERERDNLLHSQMIEYMNRSLFFIERKMFYTYCASTMNETWNSWFNFANGLCCYFLGRLLLLQMVGVVVVCPCFVFCVHWDKNNQAISWIMLIYKLTPDCRCNVNSK